jgi:hypothetical protein
VIIYQSRTSPDLITFSRIVGDSRPFQDPCGLPVGRPIGLFSGRLGLL